MKSWKKIVTLITTVGMLIAPVNVNAQNNSDVSASNLAGSDGDWIYG